MYNGSLIEFNKKEMSAMDYFSLMAIVFVGLNICIIYDIKKKNDVKLEQIKLEREKVTLELKRLEIENRTD